MLDINISTILLQMANFFILVFILYRTLFKPVQNILKKRSAETTKAMDNARIAEVEAEKTRKLFEEKTNNIDAEISARKNEARIVIEQTRQQMLKEVQSQVDQIKTQTEETLTRVEQQAIQRNKEKLGNIVTDFTEGLFGSLMTPKIEEAYQEEFISRISETDLSPYFESSTPGELPIIRVVTANKIKDSRREQIEAILNKDSRPIRILYETDPDILAGGILRFENELIDGSLRGQIQHLKQKYQDSI